MIDLNAAQAAAVASDADRLLVEAGAGTGKTRFLIERARRLHAAGRRVRMLTFTRAASREMRSRLDYGLHGLVVDTHHGCALSLLQASGWQGTVIDEVEAQAIAKQAKERGEDPARLRAANRLVTYDELIPLALRGLLPAGEDVLVDEASDNTAEEWALVEALQPRSLTVVGDRAQRIFGWRGAVEMPGDAPEWERIALAENYRSRDEILAAANRLAIPGAVTLRGVRGPSGAVMRMACDDEESMQAAVLDMLLGERCAVLGRTRARLQEFLAYAEWHGVRCYAPSLQGRLWDERAARDLIAHLHVMVNPHDSLHLERCLRQLGWPPEAINIAELGRAQEACSLWDWLCRHCEAASPEAELLRRIRLLAEGELPVATVARSLGELLGRSWEKYADAMPVAETVAGFLAWLADPDRDDGEEQGERLYVGTIHSAKGREWDHVVVLGCEAGAFPLRPRGATAEARAEEEAEERRLAYVAVTRARESVTLAWARQRRGWTPGSAVESEAGRFVKEVVE